MKKKVKKNGFKPKGKTWNGKKDFGVAHGNTGNLSPSPIVKKLATAIQMFERVGDQQRLFTNDFPASSLALNRTVGIMTIPTLHTPGISTNPNSPINDVARGMMTKIRESINANRAYESSDLFLHVFAQAELMSAVKFFNLALRLLKVYRTMNSYTPGPLLKALGFDPDDLQKNGLQLQLYLEITVERMKTIISPANIPVFSEMIETFNHIYVDADLEKAQYMVQKPQGFWKYTWNSTDSRYELKLKDWAITHDVLSGSLATVSDIIIYLNDLMVEILDDQNTAIINGDILKSFGSVIRPQPVDTTPVNFEFSMEFNYKVHNLCTVPYFAETTKAASTIWTKYIIYGSTSSYLDPYIVFDPELTLANSDTTLVAVKRGAGNRVLDFDNPEVSDDMVLEATRWMFCFNYSSDATNTTFKFDSIGTEIVGVPEIITFNNAGTQLIRPGALGAVNLSVVTGHTTEYLITKGDMNGLLVWSKFHYPYMLYVAVNAAVTTSEVGGLGVLGDFGNYTFINKNNIYHAHLCALFGQFNVHDILN